MIADRSGVAAEAARIAELERLHVVFSEPEPEFDAIAQTAATLLDAPIALISLVSRRDHWSKASYGMGARRLPREETFCDVAIRTPGDALIVRDARLDERFAGRMPVVGASGLRFYAGVPLVTKNGFAIGTLCVLDRAPRDVRPGDIAGLRALAALAMRLIEDRSEPTVIAPPVAAPRDRYASTILMFAWDDQLRVLAWNRTAERVFGWHSSEVIGAFAPMILPDDEAQFRRDCLRTLEDRGDVTRRCTVRTKDGSLLQVAMSISRAINLEGVRYGVVVIEDVGTRIATERRLAMLESVVVSSTEAVIVTEAKAVGGENYRIVYVNDAFTRMTGYSAAEAIGKTPRMLQGRGTDPAEVERISAALRQFEPVTAELTNYRKDGTPYCVELSISPVTDADGSQHFIAIERDTTERRALDRYEYDRSVILEMAVCNEPLEKQLAKIVTLLAGVIPGSMGTVMLLHGDVLTVGAADPRVPRPFLNGMAEGLRIGPEVGSCGTAVYQRTPVICGDIAHDPRWAVARDAALASGLRACWSIPMFGTNGDVIGAYALYADRAVLPTPRQLQLFEETVRFASLVVERHRDRERLEQMVLYDALTELPNRKLFESRFDAARARAESTGDAVAVGVLDIDRFKAINDAFGHHVGDLLLVHIARRLSASLRSADTIARMAGDEFLVLFTDLAAHADGITAAHRLVERFDEPFTIEGYEIFARPSLGVAFFPDTATDPAALLQAADRAMYVAKARGGGFELAVSAVAGSALEKLDLENDLRHALERNELELHYQLIFDLKTGRPVGAESLLRWRHREFGLLQPGDFIPVAEANGAIIAIGKWVIAQASRAAKSWQDERRDAFVTVNVSAMQFDEPGLVEAVISALDETGLEPHRLHLELTESLVMRNASASALMLLQLKSLGVQVVIDDFGTGYSSLAYLQRFTFDALKIDRAFVRGIGDDAVNARSERIVSAVVGLGRALGVTTIAEGVEDLEQYAFVQSCGCDSVQGFLCARPVPAADITWTYWSRTAAASPFQDFAKAQPG